MLMMVLVLALTTVEINIIRIVPMKMALSKLSLLISMRG